MNGRKHGPAFTLVEAVISSVIISVMLVAVLATVAAARMTHEKTGQQTHGTLLAQDLLAEIVAQPYTDPEDPGATSGPDTGEGTSNRTDFDDVDDYDNWSASPPQDKAGTPLSGFSGWQRAVTVQWVDPTDLVTVSFTDTGLRQIVVTVSYGGGAVTQLSAYRTTQMPVRPEVYEETTK